MQRNLEISSEKNNNSRITFEKLLYSLISSIDFLRVTSHQWLELWRIRRKKIIRRGAIPWWIVPLPSYRVGPVYSIEYFIELSSRHLSARAVCSCSRMQRGRPVKGNATLSTAFRSFFLWSSSYDWQLLWELANLLIEAELWDILYLPGILFLNRILWEI